MTKSHSAQEPETIPCNECPAGVMHIRHITYFTWLGEELITVPNFPAWVCDMCGKREFDEQAVAWLSMLLNPEAGRPTRRIPRKPQPDSSKRNVRPPMLD